MCVWYGRGTDRQTEQKITNSWPGAPERRHTSKDTPTKEKEKGEEQEEDEEQNEGKKSKRW